MPFNTFSEGEGTSLQDDCFSAHRRIHMEEEISENSRHSSGRGSRQPDHFRKRNYVGPVPGPPGYSAS